MRCIVFAYHNMGMIGIRALLEAGCEIALVVTHADNPAENVWFGSVLELCRAEGLPAITPDDPNRPELLERIRQLRPDIIFSFYYRHMLGQEILDAAPLGAYNLHGSYLPAYRGRCPVNWVLVNGERETGVTLHRMEIKPDAGPIVVQQRVAIDPDDTALTLFGKLEAAASELLSGILPRMLAGDIPQIPQDLSRGSYFGGRRPADGRIDWTRTASSINNLVRGVTRPYPGAFAFWDDRRIIFWRVAVSAGAKPGRISLAGGRVVIGTGAGGIVPLEIECDGIVLEQEEIPAFFAGHEGETLS